MQTSNQKIIAAPDPQEYPTDQIELLKEQYNSCLTDRHRKRDLKNQYNKLAQQLNEQFGRKMYLLIH